MWGVLTGVALLPLPTGSPNSSVVVRTHTCSLVSTRSADTQSGVPEAIYAKRRSRGFFFAIPIASSPRFDISGHLSKNRGSVARDELVEMYAPSVPFIAVMVTWSCKGAGKIWPFELCDWSKCPSHQT